MDIEKYFSDYKAFSETIIDDVTAQGISLKNGMYIDFSECAAVYAEITPDEKQRCVGECELADLSFTFYTLLQAVMIKFLEKDEITNLQRFIYLQKKILEYGYTTSDVN